MARAGYVKLAGREIAAYLPLGQRCILKMEQLVRQHVTERGGQEFSLRAARALPAPAARVSPQSKARPPLRKGETATVSQDLSTAPPAEERRSFREIAASHLRSYKELPQVWFQFTFTPFRDSNAYSVRCYSLSAAEVADESVRDPAWMALSNVIRECRLDVAVAQGAPEPLRETTAQEHIAYSSEGEMKVAVCGCGYSANLECAISRPEHPAGDEASPGQPRLVETPDKRTVADVSEFLGVPPASVIKSLLYIIAGGPVLALVPGDDQLNESLLRHAAASSDARPADADEVMAIFGAEPGSIGPAGQTHARVLADHALRGRRNLICGANKDGYHFVDVEPDRDFQAEYVDLRQVRAGDPCPTCGQPLSLNQACRLMRSSALRQAAPETVSLQVLGPDNRLHALSVNIHTLHLDTLLLSLVEQFSDNDGLVLPRNIAPFDVVVTPIDYRHEDQRDVCDRITRALAEGGADVLLDDRECSPGVKFKDADLIGVPLRITVGPKKLKERKVEIRARRTREVSDCGVEEVAQSALGRLLS